MATRTGEVLQATELLPAAEAVNQMLLAETEQTAASGVLPHKSTHLALPCYTECDTSCRYRGAVRCANSLKLSVLWQGEEPGQAGGGT